MSDGKLPPGWLDCARQNAVAGDGPAEWLAAAVNALRCEIAPSGAVFAEFGPELGMWLSQPALDGAIERIDVALARCRRDATKH